MKNLIYSIKDTTEKKRFLALLGDMSSQLSKVNVIKRYVNPIIKQGEFPKSIFTSWDDIVQFYNEIIRKIDDCSNIVLALTLNIRLYESGLCPFLLYAFDDWQWGLDNSNQLQRLAEFSLMYLYRIVANYTKAPNENFDLLYSSGSTSDIYIDISKNLICKAPKNFTASSYIFPQEYENACILRKTSLCKFLPKDYSYDYKYKYLYHRHVPGNTGEYYLFNHIDFTSKQIDSINDFYNTYINRIEKEIILDIHPGNFIWDTYENRWHLVDLGSLTDIGKEYYEYDTCAQYFENIWTKREENMRTYPIRSIDFGLD